MKLDLYHLTLIILLVFTVSFLGTSRRNEYERGVQDVLSAMNAQDLTGVCSIIEDYQADERIDPE